MLRRDSNPAYFSIADDLCTAYEMGDWSTGFLPLRGCISVITIRGMNTGIGQGREEGKNDILLKCTRRCWDWNPHSLIQPSLHIDQYRLCMRLLSISPQRLVD
jgi:hypothetical protein